MLVHLDVAGAVGLIWSNTVMSSIRPLHRKKENLNYVKILGKVHRCGEADIHRVGVTEGETPQGNSWRKKYLTGYS